VKSVAGDGVADRLGKPEHRGGDRPRRDQMPLSAGVHIGPNPIVATSSGPTQSGAVGKVLTWYTPAVNAAKQVTCEHGAYYQGYSTAVVTTGATTTHHSESSNRVTAC
jgi:hypothetical protein